MSNLHVEVLRLFEGQNNTSDWHRINSAYSMQDIEKIKDPASGTAKEITSIPSPFARINLFEHAFKAVTDQAKSDPNLLNENSMFHKLVSEALDVGEVLFNYDTLDFNPNYDLDILSWNRTSHLQELKNSSYPKHNLLGETLELYLSQDKEGSNFDKMKYIHLVQCNYTIIGGTSPSTLFFTAHNDNFRLGELGLKMGNDILFDAEFNPLHYRATAFQRYLHGMFKVFPHLQYEIPIFFEYLKVSLEFLKRNRPTDHRNIMTMLDDDHYGIVQFNAEFEELSSGNAGNVLELFPDIYLRKNSAKAAKAVGQISDFTIKSDFPDKEIGGVSPLILVNGFRKPLKYYGSNWDPSYEVPYSPEPIIDERILPGQMVKYPYLTTSDFLEPYLIKLDYRIDNEHFFNGNPVGFFPGNKSEVNPPDPSYLLPIKPIFFEFFNANKLREKAADGKPIFRMKKVGSDSVLVELRIPIQKEGECIVLDRIYRVEELPNEANNEGAIVEYQMNLGFLPMVVGNGSFYQYVGLIDNDIVDETISNDYQLYFYRSGNSSPIEPSYDRNRSNKHQHRRNASSHYYVLEEPYDFISVDTGNARGVVVPFFRKVSSGGKQFSFAIDFGTTNTHIEYSVDGARPIPFEVNEDEVQFVTLIERDSDWYFRGMAKDLFFHEFVPELIGKRHSYRFPIRTVTTEIENLNHNAGATIPLADINICFIYEKWQILKNTEIETNLKWQNFDPKSGAKSISRLKACLGELLFLIRNKIILNGGDLKRTDIIWFFPSSMDDFQVQQFSNTWEELARKYISEECEPIRYSEAIVPFYMHKDQKVQGREYPVVSIDIGGGTTDFAIFEKDQPVFISSAKFAGNVVWGDGFSTFPDSHNGIVRVFKPVVRQFLESNRDNGLFNLYGTFEQLENDPQFSSADLMSFFFSIDRNQDVMKKRLDFNFSGKLGESQDFKIVFLTFYAGITYYLARLMHISGIEKPRYITLSGNGSRIFKLLDPDKKFKSATKLATFIFQRVYGNSYYEDGLSIVQHPDPKESTCKGGLRRRNSKLTQKDYDTVVWIGDKPKDDQIRNQNEDSSASFNDQLGTIVNSVSHNFPSQQLKYRQITEEIKGSVLDEYKHFLKLLEAGHRELDYKNLFGVRAEKMDFYMEVLNKDARSHLSAGLGQRLEVTASSLNIVESLLFYPMIGGIYRLSQEIADELDY